MLKKSACCFKKDMLLFQIIKLLHFKLSNFLLAGYRHITLKSNTGDAIPNCTLFVHVAITNKRGGGVSSSINHCSTLSVS